MKVVIKDSFERMLQGLTYWLAYKDTTYKCSIIEADAVMEACQILQGQLPRGFKVEREFSYSNISSTFVNKRADLAILDDQNHCLAIIEFKLADSTNGGYTKDVGKLSVIKSLYRNIDCYVVILYRKSCNIDVPGKLVRKDGKATRKDIRIGGDTIRVRRVFNAISSKTAKKMKRVIWLEVL